MLAQPNRPVPVSAPPAQDRSLGWGRLLAGFALALLITVCGGGGGGDKSGPAGSGKVTLEAQPREAALTAGESLQLGCRITGTTDTRVRWRVLETDGGQVSADGSYRAPVEPGNFHVRVDSIPHPEVTGEILVRVHPTPVAVDLRADYGRIRQGAVVTLTAEFRGGAGILLPGCVALTSGVPVELTPAQDTTYTLRVQNPIGAVAEKQLKIQVDPMSSQPLRGINAPDSIRIGNYHVAWLDQRVGAQLEWQSDQVDFLGDSARPQTPMVVFTPKPGASHFALRVRARGGGGLVPGGAPLLFGSADEAEFDFKGRVEPAAAEDPIIQVDRPFLTVGRSNCRARVENLRPGTRYVWRIQNGLFPESGRAAEGDQVTFKTGHAAYLLLTCEATAHAGGATHATTLGVVLVQPPDPPLIQAGDRVIAGVQQWGYVQSARPGEKYHWEIDPAQGRLEHGGSAAVGPMTGFTVTAPGPFTLKCRAENQAGDLSAATTLTLTAVGPFALKTPELNCPKLLRLGSGPHSVTVAHPVPGLVYSWSVVGGTLNATSGTGVELTAGTGDFMVLKCTALEPATGSRSVASQGIKLVKPPAVPVILGPAAIAPGTTHLAQVLGGGRSGETYHWTVTNGALRAAGRHSATAVFDSGAEGAYELTCTAENGLGDRSGVGRFTGLVVRVGVGSGSGSSSGPSSGPGPSSSPGPNSGPSSGPSPSSSPGPSTGPSSGPSSGPGPGSGPGSSSSPGPSSGSISTSSPSPGAGPGFGFGPSPSPGAGPGFGFGPSPSPSPGAGSGFGFGPSPSSSPGFSFSPAGGGGRLGTPGIVGATPGLKVAYPELELIAGKPMVSQPPVPDPLPAMPGPVSFKLEKPLPDGLRLDENTGIISGTPTIPGDTLFSVITLSGPQFAVSDPILWRVVPDGPLTLAYALPGPFRTGQAIPVQLPVIGMGVASAPHSFQVTAGQLPVGLKLDPATGAISGWPVKPGLASCTITVVNGARDAGTRLDFQIDAGPRPTLALAGLRNDDKRSILVQAVAEHWPPEAKFTVVDGHLPRGLDLMGTMVMGTARETGTFKFRLRGDDGFTRVESDPVTFEIDPFTPPRILNFEPSALVIEPGEKVDLSWAIAGYPEKLTLTRNLFGFPEAGEPEDPDRTPEIKIPAGVNQVSLPVVRRQEFELAIRAEELVKPKFGKATRAWVTKARVTHKIGVRGIDFVAGKSIDSAGGEYSDGVFGEAGKVLEITGAVAHGGEITFSEGSSHTLRRLQPGSRELTHFLGRFRGPDRAPAKAHLAPGDRLDHPGGLAVADGHIYICDTGSHTLKRCALDGTGLEVVAGAVGMPGDASGLGPAARFSHPVDIAVHDSGYGFVADDHGLKIVRLATGDVKKLDGLVAPGGHALAAVAGVAVDPHAGVLYLTGGPDPAFAIYALRPDHPHDLWGSHWHAEILAGEGSGCLDGPALHARFKNPAGLLLKDRQLLVADRDNNCIRSINLDGSRMVRTLAGSNQPDFQDGQVSSARFKRPNRILPGPDPQRVLVVDQNETALRELKLDLDPGTRIWAGKEVGTLVRALPPAGWTRKNPARPAVKDDPIGYKARFSQPLGLVVDRVTGDAFLVEKGSHAVRKVVLEGGGSNPTAKVTTFAGQFAAAPPAATPSANKIRDPHFSGPTEIQLDGDGRIFVLEPKANRVKVIQSVTTGPKTAYACTTFLSGFSNPEPHHRGIHMAALNAFPGELSLALSAYVGDPVHRNWEVRLYHHGVGAGHHLLRDSVAVMAEEPQALAMDLNRRVYVLVSDPDAQVCRIRIYGMAPGAPGWALQDEVRFGPGADQGNGFGFPVIPAMATDSKGNLFLADPANGLIWMMRGADRSLHPIVGKAGVLRFPGESLQALDAPLSALNALAVTGQDDLCISCGDAIYMVTAPGSHAHPWTPPLPVACATLKPPSGVAAPAGPASPGKDMVAELALKRARAARANGQLADAITSSRMYLAIARKKDLTADPDYQATLGELFNIGVEAKHHGQLEAASKAFAEFLTDEMELDPRRAKAQDALKDIGKSASLAADALMAAGHPRDGLAALNLLLEVTRTAHGPDFDAALAQILRLAMANKVQKEAKEIYRLLTDPSLKGRPQYLKAEEALKQIEAQEKRQAANDD